MSECSFIQPDKSSSHMQSKTAYFFHRQSWPGRVFLLLKKALKSTIKMIRSISKAVRLKILLSLKD